MTTNMGKIDRGLRLVIGAALLILALATDRIAGGWLFWAALIIGAVFVLTALVGNCPLYSIIGVRTCPRS